MRFVCIEPVQPENDIHQLRPFYALLTSLFLLIFLFLVVLAGTNTGLTALFLAIVLSLFFPGDQKWFIRQVPWYAVIVMAGLLTYVGGMVEIGTMDAVQKALMGITDNHLLLFIIIAYLVSLLCNVESSTLGVFGMALPMFFAIFHTDVNDMTILLATVVAPATLSVLNPIHLAGPLMMGYTQEAQQTLLFKRLLCLSLIVMVVAPDLATLMSVIVGLY